MKCLSIPGQLDRKYHQSNHFTSPSVPSIQLLQVQPILSTSLSGNRATYRGSINW
ncbi:hypothetical protein BDV25DRAFT_152821 [Aspergillus avenaceus]|uniref:Uncharacterized protein n=1 Tax=Aspergillus avenaceus TaxID=36643 RepID=A0A5N6TY64_ASPAV|nr:hypothetical protein BDV25DRAFT_152821 [Aspergillus avenaceus]